MPAMSAHDLTEKYGGNTARAINKAIRAELPAGALVLDGLDRLNQLTRAARTPELGEALDILRSIADEMRAEIRRRYEV